MSLSSDLAAYFSKLEAAHGGALLYQPNVLELLGGTPDFLSFTASLEKLTPEQRTLVTLTALASQKRLLAPHLADSELVVTFPGDDLISARHTLQVVRQMIESAKTEILLAGFAMTESGGVFDLLAGAAKRGVRVILLCSDWRGPDQMTGAMLTRQKWPTGIPSPVLYEYASGGNSAGMHIKCLLADGAEILLGSANFTFHGLNQNFEMGIRTKGEIAGIARRVFDEFLATGRFKKVEWHA